MGRARCCKGRGCDTRPSSERASARPVGRPEHREDLRAAGGERRRRGCSRRAALGPLSVPPGWRPTPGFPAGNGDLPVNDHEAGWPEGIPNTTSLAGLKDLDAESPRGVCQTRVVAVQTLQLLTEAHHGCQVQGLE